MVAKDHEIRAKLTIEDFPLPYGPALSPEQIMQIADRIADRIQEKLSPPVLVETPEACRLLGGVSPRWLFDNRSPRGMCIPWLPCGDKVKFRVEALKKWAQDHEQTSDTAPQ